MVEDKEDLGEFLRDLEENIDRIETLLERDAEQTEAAGPDSLDIEGVEVEHVVNVQNMEVYRVDNELMVPEDQVAEYLDNIAEELDEVIRMFKRNL